MNRTKYNEIINGEETYNEIADKLKQNIPVVIGWTDEDYSHFDILFVYKAYREPLNYLQRGFKSTDLFVSLLGWGSSYGFEIDREKDKGYISEKLNVHGETASKLTKLINEVIKRLREGG